MTIPQGKDIISCTVGLTTGGAVEMPESCKGRKTF
jgi:predicted TIM-barrel enzyme